mmetsp:Transcript_118801/g.193333  ORF Transcript_118801/g.193333 Transcript_118801/m.193333 type:complete len:111 (+) Transcript_118801:509-841(+)
MDFFEESYLCPCSALQGRLTRRRGCKHAAHVTVDHSLLVMRGLRSPVEKKRQKFRDELFSGISISNYKKSKVCLEHAVLWDVVISHTTYTGSNILLDLLQSSGGLEILRF